MCSVRAAWHLYSFVFREHILDRKCFLSGLFNCLCLCSWSESRGCATAGFTVFISWIHSLSTRWVNKKTNLKMPGVVLQDKLQTQEPSYPPLMPTPTSQHSVAYRQEWMAPSEGPNHTAITRSHAVQYHTSPPDILGLIKNMRNGWASTHQYLHPEELLWDPAQTAPVRGTGDTSVLLVNESLEPCLYSVMASTYSLPF